MTERSARAKARAKAEADLPDGNYRKKGKGKGRNRFVRARATADDAEIFGAYLGMLISTVLLALVLQSKASPQAGTGPLGAVDALNAVDARFVVDLHDKKIDDVLTLYSDDAVFVNPDGTEAAGPGLRKLYEQVAKAFDSDLHLKRVSLKHDLNTILEDGTYTEELGHRDTGKTDEVKGTYRFTLHLEADGQWRYSRMEWH